MTANIPAPPHNPEAAAQADTECAAALDPTTGQPPENPPPEPQQHTTQAAAAGPSLASASASNSPSSSNCCPSRRPVAGHPAALTMQALLSGGWAVGCVEMQQQEQSCWVRFNLPHELVRTPAVLQALNRRELVRTTHTHACAPSPPQLWHKKNNELLDSALIYHNSRYFMSVAYVILWVFTKCARRRAHSWALNAAIMLLLCAAVMCAGGDPPRLGTLWLV